MKLGAEPKKVALLGGLLLAAGYLLYTNVLSGPPDAPAPAASGPAVSRMPAIPGPGSPKAEARPRAGAAGAGTQEFRPSLKPRRPEERLDPSTIDPTLRLDLLEKLQKVRLEGGERSLFEFSSAPLPKTPEPKIIPKNLAQAKQEEAPPPTPAALIQPAKPTAPPIALKFYGFATPPRPGIRRAFFLDGDEILVAGEGEVMKKRYKVVRIGINSVVVEDLQFQSQQTLRLEEQPG